MSKFLTIVEQNNPDLAFGEQFDTLMDVKDIINRQPQLGVLIVPIENKPGTVRIELKGGKSVTLKVVPEAKGNRPLGIQGSEEAEDPISKEIPTSSSLAADLVKKDTRVQRSMEPAIRKVADVLNKYARN